MASDIDVRIEVEQDNSKIIADAINEALASAMDTVGLVAEGYAQRLCPVDTGRLWNSITHQLKESGKSIEVYIGTNVEYGPHVEMGTSTQKAQPFLRPAANRHTAEYKSIIKKAMQNG